VKVPVLSDAWHLITGDSGKITVRAGGSVDFPHGIPPLNAVALLANLHLMFLSCDTGPYKPLGDRTSLRAASAGDKQFTITKGTGPSFISLEGAGGAPHVRLHSPNGQVLDYRTVTGNTGKRVGDTWGTILEQEDRTVVLLPRPAAGRWTAETATGSPRVVRVRRADVLPPPALKANVTGKGPRRVLHYNIFGEKGQAVRFLEVADGKRHLIRTIGHGGRGKFPFTVAEAKSRKRTIEANVLENGLPRVTKTVAHFTASSPRVGKPRKVRVRRHGHTAIVTWKPAAFAKAYEVTVTYGVGRRIPLLPKGKSHRLTVPTVKKGEGLKVEVAGVSATGHRGPAAIGHLKGSMHVGSHKHKEKHKPDNKRSARQPAPR
jgi:hypothetical protein